VFGALLRGFGARRRPRTAAELACRALRPGERLHGSWVCADEAGRYVVRLFCGERRELAVKLPPWRECLVFFVKKGTQVAELIVDDGPYRPVIR
jgi:hypothetical protein